MSRLKLDRGLLGGVVLLAAVIIANAAVSHVNVDALDRARREVEQSDAVLDAMQELFSTVQEAESGQRGFLLTGEARYLEPYEVAVREVDEQFAQLETLVSVDHGGKAELADLRPVIDAKFTELAETVRLRRERDFESARAVVGTDRGIGLMEQIRARFGEMKSDEQRRRAERLAAAQSNRDLAAATAIVAGVLNLALLLSVVVLLKRSLSERTAAAARLRQQKELFRTTLASIGDAVIATDVEGRVTFLNGVAEALTGYAPEFAVGRPLTSVFHVINEDTHEAIENPGERALREGVIVGLANHTILVANDGREHPIHDSAAPIRDENGRVRGVVLVFRDITETRRAAKQLEDADHRKDEFLAVLAHELRNPLAPLRNALQVLRLSGHDPIAVRNLSELMERQLEQMVRLIDDLMDVSLITRNQLPLRKESLPIEAIVQSAYEMSQPILEQRKQKVTLALPNPSIRVCVDKTRMTQALCNLLRNAAKYSNPGGHVRLSVEPAGRDVLLRVQDTGIGIPPEMLDRVFEMFTQVDRSLERSQGGLGIGLALVRRIVERHGGTIEARSEGVGRGSEFVIRLPVVADVERAAAPAEKGRAASTRRIVVADDNRDSADSLALMLRMSGHEVAVAYDGEQALAVADRFHPEVMLVDLGMPKLDGHAVARRVRERTGGQVIRLVALTGWGQEDDRRRSDAAGFDRHLVKPIAPQELAKVLASLWPGRSEAESK